VLNGVSSRCFSSDDPTTPWSQIWSPGPHPILDRHLSLPERQETFAVRDNRVSWQLRTRSEHPPTATPRPEICRPAVSVAGCM
jgi:hypothetical protein